MLFPGVGWTWANRYQICEIDRSQLSHKVIESEDDELPECDCHKASGGFINRLPLR